MQAIGKISIVPNQDSLRSRLTAGFPFRISTIGSLDDDRDSRCKGCSGVAVFTVDSWRDEKDA